MVMCRPGGYWEEWFQYPSIYFRLRKSSVTSLRSLSRLSLSLSLCPFSVSQQGVLVRILAIDPARLSLSVIIALCYYYDNFLARQPQGLIRWLQELKWLTFEILSFERLIVNFKSHKAILAGALGKICGFPYSGLPVLMCHNGHVLLCYRIPWNFGSTHLTFNSQFSGSRINKLKMGGTDLGVCANIFRVLFVIANIVYMVSG